MYKIKQILKIYDQSFYHHYEILKFAVHDVK